MARGVLSRHYLVRGGAPPPPARVGPHPHAKAGLRPVAANKAFCSAGASSPRAEPRTANPRTADPGRVTLYGLLLSNSPHDAPPTSRPHIDGRRRGCLDGSH